MQNSKLIRLLSSLSKEELKRFDAFIRSPFFNNKQQPIILFEYLKQRYDKWYPLIKKQAKSPREVQETEKLLHKYLSKERVYKKLFPKDAYNDARIRRIMSYCKLLLDDFLIQLAFESEQENNYRRLLRLRYHSKRQESSLFRESLKSVEENLNNIPYQDQEYYLYAYQIEQERNNHLVRQGKTQESYQQLANHFDSYFLLSKLRIFSAMLNRQKTLKVQYTFNMMEEILMYLETNLAQQVPPVVIYYYILKLGMGTASQKDYNHLVETLEKHKSLISPDELRQIYSFMLNHLIRESRKPGTDRHTETFALLKIMLAEGFLYVNQKILIQYFNLCVVIACRINELDWAEDFIYEHEDRLVGANHKEVFDYTFLSLLFYKQDYEEILKRIDSMRFKEARYQIMRRMLKLKTLFECEREDAFFLLTDSLKKFIRSKKDLGDTARVYYTNFVSFTERLGKVRFDQRSVSQDLIQGIQEGRTADKEWLQEKLDQLTRR